MIDKLKNRSVQTICLIVLYAICAPYFSMHIHQSLYTISVFIKDTLIWLMPITVGIFIASTIDSFERKAPLFILILVLFEGCSNLLSVWYAYGSALIVSSELPGFKIVVQQDDFAVLWRMPFTKPGWWGAVNGSIAGLIIGSVSAFIGPLKFKASLRIAKNTVEAILIKGFGSLIPIFVIGFIAQIYKTGMLDHIIVNYSILMLYLVIALIIYIFFIFLVGNLFRLLPTITNIRNLIPAGMIALSSACSLSTMPWTIKGTAKNLKDPELAKAIIPATTNIQQIGDCLANAFLCFLVYKSFFGINPDIIIWSTFTLVFVVTRFAAAGVTGGSTFLMLPIYQHYLSFNDEMIAIMLTMNVILDPIITSCNVMANGGLAKIFENVWRMVCGKED